MEYYFVSKEYISPGSLTIVDDEAKHLVRVLRKKSGEEIYVTDGEGNLYKTKISNISKEIIECTVIEKFFNLNEPSIKITLYPALIKNPARFEFIIEKSVELGVYEIQPVISENVVNKPTDKTERWQQIALSAMKQSQRCYLPKVKPPMEFKDAVLQTQEDLKLMADEKDQNGCINLSAIKQKPSSAVLFIGPEGGFTRAESDFALSNNFKLVNLGARKYRSETASILCLGLLLNLPEGSTPPAPGIEIIQD